MDEFINFLIKARNECYQSGASPLKPTRPNSYDLEYTNGKYTYRLSSLGGLDSVGQEAIWMNNRPIWAMNYNGRVVSDGFHGTFFREALLEIDHDHPFRGPCYYKKGDYTYVSSTEGDLLWFYGREEIYHEEKLVYEGFFHGGRIK